MSHKKKYEQQHGIFTKNGSKEDADNVEVKVCRRNLFRVQ